MRTLSRRKEALLSPAEEEAEALWDEHWPVLLWWASTLARLHHATHMRLAVQERHVGVFTAWCYVS